MSNDGDANDATTGTTSAKLVDLVKALAKRVADLEESMNNMDTAHVRLRGANQRVIDLEQVVQQVKTSLEREQAWRMLLKGSKIDKESREQEKEEFVNTIRGIVREIIATWPNAESRAAVQKADAKAFEEAAKTTLTPSAITPSHTITQQPAVEESNMTATSPMDLEDDSNGSAEAAGGEGKATTISVVEVDKSDTSDS